MHLDMNQKLILLTMLLSIASAVFNCNRDTAQCLQSSTCNSATGKCTCAAGTSGDDCGVTDTEVDAAPCVASCGNGGTCTGDGASFTCHCPEDYFGTTCETPRYEITCTTGDMTVKITPHIPTFSGGIFPYQRLREPTCYLTVQSGQTYTTTLTHAHITCGGAVDVAGADTRYYYIIFEDNGDIFLGEMVTAKCTGTTGTISSATITDADIDGVLATTQVNYVVENSDLEMVVTKGNGDAITGNLLLGDQILVKTKLADASAEFEALRVESCEVNNGVVSTDPSYLNLDLIDGSCQTEAAKPFFHQNPTKTSNKEVEFTILTVKFYDTDTLDLECILQACGKTAGCDTVQCNGEDAPYTGYGKRKRSTNTKLVTAKVQFTVLPFVRGDMHATIIGAKTNGAKYLSPSWIICIVTMMILKAQGYS